MDDLYSDLCINKAVKNIYIYIHRYSTAIVCLLSSPNRLSWTVLVSLCICDGWQGTHSRCSITTE